MNTILNFKKSIRSYIIFCLSLFRVVGFVPLMETK